MSPAEQQTVKGIRVVNAKGAAQSKKLTVPPIRLSNLGLARVVTIQQQNEQRERPMVKTRGLVAATGRKPWRQKGTGRARAGSYASPIWRGGGVTFGPSGRPRRYKKLSQAFRRAARQTALAVMAEHGRLVVLAGPLSLQKTKAAAILRTKVIPEGSILTIVEAKELDQMRGIRNLRDVDLTTTDDVTVADLLQAQTLLVSEAAYQELTSPTKGAKAPAAKPSAKKTSTKKAVSPPRTKKSPAKAGAKKQATKPAKKSTSSKRKPASKRKSAKAEGKK